MLYHYVYIYIYIYIYYPKGHFAAALPYLAHRPFLFCYELDPKWSDCP